jgi:hypothetical protein
MLIMLFIANSHTRVECSTDYTLFLVCKAVSVELHSLCQAFLLLLLMTTGFVAEFSFCVPHAATNYISYGLIFHTVLDYTSQNRDRHPQDILILKGTKHQLSVYDNILMVYFLLC